MAIEVSETTYRKRREMIGRTFEVIRPWSAMLVSRQYGKVDIIVQPENKTEAASVQVVSFTKERVEHQQIAVAYKQKKEVAFLTGDEINTLGPLIGKGGKKLVLITYKGPNAEKIAS